MFASGMDIGSSFHQSHRALYPTIEINVLVCLVVWDDHEGRIIPDPNHFRELWNGESGTVANPGESISNWLYSNTYGDYSAQARVVDWMPLNETEAYWANGNMGHGNGTSIGEAFVPVLEAAAESGIDLSMYDYDNDGLLDSIVFVHSGFAAELGGVDCFTGANHTDRIMSNTWDTDINIGSTGLKLGSFITVSAFNNLCDVGPANIGIHLQQWLRSHFGISDTFDLGGRYHPENSIAVGGLGAYDIMSFAGGQAGRADFPGILSPFGKMELGSLEPIEITTDGVYTARASALFPDVYKISSPYPPGEYLLIENRQPVLSDLYLWQPGGIVIYHVDENTGGNGNRVRGGPFLEGWPGNGAHYKVAVLQADGKYELEQGLNQGHIDDFWKAGDVLGPGNGETVATSNGTYPNTDSYVGGNIRVTGLQIDQFQETQSGVWSFRVSNLVPIAALPPSTPSPPSQSPTYSYDIFQHPRNGQVNCYGPILNDPNFYCDCMDDCTAKSNFVCACSEAKACCFAFVESIDDPLSEAPSLNPTRQPSVQPSTVPTMAPSGTPSLSRIPSLIPSQSPSMIPSHVPSFLPSVTPSYLPTESMAPSSFPTMTPRSINVVGMGAGFIVAIVLLLLLLMMMHIIMLYKRIQQEQRQQQQDHEQEERDGILRPLEQVIDHDHDAVSTLTPSLISSIPSITSALRRMRYGGSKGSSASIDYEPPPVPPRRQDSGRLSTNSSLENYGWSV